MCAIRGSSGLVVEAGISGSGSGSGVVRIGLSVMGTSGNVVVSTVCCAVVADSFLGCGISELLPPSGSSCFGFCRPTLLRDEPTGFTAHPNSSSPPKQST